MKRTPIAMENGVDFGGEVSRNSGLRISGVGLCGLELRVSELGLRVQGFRACGSGFKDDGGFQKLGAYHSGSPGAAKGVYDDL